MSWLVQHSQRFLEYDVRMWMSVFTGMCINA